MYTNYDKEAIQKKNLDEKEMLHIVTAFSQ